MTSRTLSLGAGFLLDTVDPADIGIPEDLTSEQRELQLAVRTFVETEVIPRQEELDAMKPGLMQELLAGLGQLGFFQLEPDPEMGGEGLGIFPMLALMEEIGRGGCLGVAAMVHQGIGSQPIGLYGTHEQHETYTHELLAGRQIAAYALTEPNSGSDALAMQTTARWDAASNQWVLNGTKQFISNAAWASLFTVFAKVDGEKVTAFLIPRNTPGFEVLGEEHKMGIKGSSTCPLRLKDVRLPKEAVLGEIGKGHKIALNMLNLGRLKLGTTMLGANKRALAEAVSYANERRQFGKALTSFGMIRQKIAECASLIFAGESIAYRTAGLIAQLVETTAESAGVSVAKQRAAEEYSIECAMAKIFLTESATVIADHAVQMLGGYGFIEEYPAARNYRDVRVSRLYEGTNEINRMVIVNNWLRRAASGHLGENYFQRLRDMRPVSFDTGDATELSRLRLHLEHLKGVMSMVVASLLKRYGNPEELKNEQEHLSAVADIAMELFAGESSLLRVCKIVAAGGNERLATALAHMSFYRSARVIRERAEASLALVLPEGERSDAIELVHRSTAFAADHLRHARVVAEAVISSNGVIPDLLPAGGR